MSILKRGRSLMALVLTVLCGAALMIAVPTFAQESRAGQAMGIGIVAGMFLFMLVIVAAIYVYVAFALQTIAKKTSTPNDWWAWVPILQQILVLNIAKKPVWWLILFFVPLLNLVIVVITFMAIAEALKKPNWWGILMIVPGVNLIVPGYLAWAN